ncbi:unnamed protein product, partial [Symbiodinium sp. KB8]
MRSTRRARARAVGPTNTAADSTVAPAGPSAALLRGFFKYLFGNGVHRRLIDLKPTLGSSVPTDMLLPGIAELRIDGVKRGGGKAWGQGDDADVLQEVLAWCAAYPGKFRWPIERFFKASKELHGLLNQSGNH